MLAGVRRLRGHEVQGGWRNFVAEPEHDPFDMCRFKLDDLNRTPAVQSCRTAIPRG